MLLLLILGSMVTFVQADEVAKVIIIKGKVSATSESGVRELKQGIWISEGEVIKTGHRSFVKLLFIDKSSMNLGPKSEMKVKSFPRNEAGLVSLLKGQLRAKVSKNYMEIDKQKSKLFIQTKSAAMGVRGTDFQVLYNPNNSVTSLVTFEGSVAMTTLGREIASQNRDFLEKQLNRPEAVTVTRGKYSGVMPGQNRATIPVKMSPSQLETMRSNESGIENEKKQTKSLRSIVPPGVEARKFAVTNKSVASELGNALGGKVAAKLMETTEKTIATERASAPPPEGFFDKSTGSYAPPAGGLVDSKTALYVPPPKGSAYDSNANVFVPPPSVGTYDKETGNYIPPVGYKLVYSGDFVPENANTRTPSSTDTVQKTNLEPVPDKIALAPEGETAAETNQLQGDINVMQMEFQETFENPPPPPLPPNFSQVNFTLIEN